MEKESKALARANWKGSGIDQSGKNGLKLEMN